MPRLLYCYVSVFGSNFDAEGFGSEVNLPGAEIGQRERSYSRSPIRALIQGNVHEWKTPKHYYKYDSVDISKPFSDYLYEEKAIVSFVTEMQYINDILPAYRTDTTEIWLHLVYGVTNDEIARGVFFGKELIDAAYKLGAAISTDVTFVAEDEKS